MRQNRPRPFGADRHGDRGAIDQRRGEEIAVVGLIDGVGRNACSAGGIDDLPIVGFIAGGGKDEGRSLDLLGGKSGAHGVDAIGNQEGMIIGLRLLGVGDNPRPRVEQQPHLGESFVAIAEDSRFLALHAKEGWKYRKLLSLGRHHQSTSKLPEYARDRQGIEGTEIRKPQQARILLLAPSAI